MTSAPVVVIAPDKFKGTLTASEVADAIGAGLRAEAPECEQVLVPMADGGDGTVAALVAGGWELRNVRAVDALGRQVDTIAARHEGTVLVELANICGIAGLDGKLEPWAASTRGLGLALRSLLDADVTEVIVALGGSASTDGGAGLLAGLGFALLDATGSPVADGLLGLSNIDRIVAPDDLAELSSLTWTVLCDVDAPLLGPDGAAYVFGPQKGLRFTDLDSADDALAHWEAVLADFGGRSVGYEPHAGAAGGTAAALMAVFGAQAVSGAQFIAEQRGLAHKVQAADLVVTGEGRFDRTSLTGKAPGVVLQLCEREGVAVVLVTGSIDSDAPLRVTDRVMTLTDACRGSEDPFVDTRELLIRIGRQIGSKLLPLRAQ